MWIAFEGGASPKIHFRGIVLQRTKSRGVTQSAIVPRLRCLLCAHRPFVYVFSWLVKDMIVEERKKV